MDDDSLVFPVKERTDEVGRSDIAVSWQSGKRAGAMKSFFDRAARECAAVVLAVVVISGLGVSVESASPAAAATPFQLVITSTPVSGAMTSGYASNGPLTVTEEDSSGNPVAAPTGGTLVTLTSSSATTTFGGNGSSQDAPTATIPAGSSSVSFYWGDPTPGPLTITASATGLASGSQAESQIDYIAVDSVVTEANSGTPLSEPMAVYEESSPLASIVSYAISSGSLPPGMSMAPTSGVSGTPTTAGTYTAYITATDSFGYTGTGYLTVTVLNSVTISPSGPMTLPTGQPISIQLSASDSSPNATIVPNSWSDYLTAFNVQTVLPPGLSLSPTGLISGIPTKAGTYYMSLQVTDSAGCVGYGGWTWTITNVVTVRPSVESSPPDYVINPVTLSASDSGGSAITSWAVASGSLPPGLGLSPAGVVTGTPTGDGSYSATVTATDAAGFSGSATVNWTVANDTVTVSPVSESTNGGQSVGSVALTATDSGSTAPITSWAVTGGSLPPGLTLSPSGAITGTPAAPAGTFVATVTATDADGYAGTGTVTWSVVNPMYVRYDPNETTALDEPVSPLNVPLADPSSPISSWSVVGGSLPPGLTLSASGGVISGTPTSTGTYSATVQGTDAFGFADTVDVFWTVDGPPVITSAATATFTLGVAGSFTITTVGVPAATFSSFQVPAGLNLTDNGDGTATISGTPSAGSAGTYSIPVWASNFAGSANQTLSLTVLESAPTVTIASSANPSKSGAAVTYTVSVSSPSTGWTPTGQVTLDDNGVAKCTNITLSDGTATCRTASPASGTHAVSASYSGDLNFLPATASISQLVAGTGTSTVSVASSSNPSTYGAAVTLTATVDGSTATPTGTVAFVATVAGTATTVCSATSGSGTTASAICSYTPPAAGNTGVSANVVATYSGDANYASKASPKFTQSTLGANPLTGFILTSSANPTKAGKTVTYTVTLTGAVGTPSGTVTFSDNGTALSCGGNVDSEGTATCKYTPSGSGSHTITAVYSGDANYSPAAVPTSFTEVVD